MHVESLSAKDFRNFESLKLELSPGINILSGDNAQGKTNCLEAVYLCSTGRSQRAGSDRELIMFGKKEAYVQTVVKATTRDKIDVHLKRDEKKGVAVNGLALKKLGELYGVLLTVMFSPEDLQLVKAGPALRRQFMDMELCQLSNVYYYNLQQYYHILKQRNNLLKSIQKKATLKETLFLWDAQLVDFGSRIMSQRIRFVDRINLTAGSIHQSITNQKETLEIMYRPSAALNEYAERLNRNIDRDILMGSTSVGIHKDDLLFNVNGSDARIYGSQGQQRTASLSVKLAEIDIIREDKQNSPVLLLDDVLSELDGARQKYLLETIHTIQTVITCTGAENILHNLASAASVFYVANAKITEASVF